MNPLAPTFGSGKNGKREGTTVVSMGAKRGGGKMGFGLDGTWLNGTGIPKDVSCPCGLLQRPVVVFMEAPGMSVHSSAKLPCRSAADGTVAGTVSPCRLRKPS